MNMQREILRFLKNHAVDIAEVITNIIIDSYEEKREKKLKERDSNIR